MAEISRVLGRAEEERLFMEYAQGAKKAYQYLFLKNGTIDTDRQAKLVRPLALGLLEGREKQNVEERLVKAVKNRDYTIGTGFLSTPFVLTVLTESGNVEMAYRMLQNEKTPGWLAEVNAGATTVWEDWEGKESHNHYSPGAVCEWLFTTAAGIRVEGENSFVIRPIPDPSLQEIKAYHTSIYGKVLVEDGRIWLYYGNGPLRANHDKKRKKASMCVELEADMMTLKTEARALIPTIHNAQGTGFEGHEFFEASSIRKYEGKYYFIYSSIHAHELCYAVSALPDRNFTYGGTLISNGDIRPEEGLKTGFNSKASFSVRNYIGNNHGSLIEINGSYYIFYHRHTNRNMFSRQACAEKIEKTEDGRFLQTELTSCGLNNGPLEGKGSYEARIACHLYSAKGALFSAHPMIQNKSHPALTQDGKDREDNPDQHIENMRDGATAGFRYFKFLQAKKISVTVRGKGEGSFVVRDATDGNVVAKIPILPSKSWNEFEAPLQIEDGIRSLYFTYVGKGSVDFLCFHLS